MLFLFVFSKRDGSSSDQDTSHVSSDWMMMSSITECKKGRELFFYFLCWTKGELKKSKETKPFLSQWQLKHLALCFPKTGTWKTALSSFSFLESKMCTCEGATVKITAMLFHKSNVCSTRLSKSRQRSERWDETIDCHICAFSAPYHSDIIQRVKLIFDTTKGTFGFC